MDTLGIVTKACNRLFALCNTRPYCGEDGTLFARVPVPVLEIILDFVSTESVRQCVFVCRRWCPVALKVYLLKVRQLWSFGLGSCGRLGFAHNSCSLPRKVTFRSDVSILNVSGGSTHTAVVDASGHAYCFGYNHR
ncbi:hypothetical protein Pelo_18409 [Pelomyxa schiedti]|nr:hypothetical protein Pelo_18409 [Pelomyxa schiedti]